MTAKRFAGPRFAGDNILPAYGMEGERQVASEGKRFLAHLGRVADPADLPALISLCAGRRVVIPLSPETMRDESWIVIAVGREKADALVLALNDDERYGVDIEVPFNGQGLMASVHRAIEERIKAGLRSGRPVSIIAAECGISRRAVQLQVAKLRRSGLLPAVDEAAAAADRYRRPTRATHVAAALTVAQAGGDERSGLNVACAFAEAASIDANPSGQPIRDKNSSLSREARALALISRVHGQVVRELITEACRGKKVSLTPEAVSRQEHPFRVALDVTDSRLLALRIVTALASSFPLKFFGDWRLAALSKTSLVRERLQRGEHPGAVAAAVGISPKLAWKVKAELDRKHHRQSRLMDAVDQGDRR